MKNQLLISLITLIWSTICLGQTPDYQWLISSGNGKSNFITTAAGSVNEYNNSLTATQFTLNGVSLPNVANHSSARNDLFIIYHDYNHFNSRDISTTDRFYIAGPRSSEMNHNFLRNHTHTIDYLYLTDGYETDDPPLAVSVTTGNTGTNTAYVTDLTDAPLLTATHEVVFTKDITLIINISAINNKLEPGDTFDLRLSFDAIEEISHPHHISGGKNILDVSPIFGGGVPDYGYPTGSITPAPGNPEEVIISNGQEDYRYLNLKTNDNAFIYAPVPEGTFKAVFTLKLNGSEIATLKEEIRHSHDPNFLRVDSIAEASDGGYYVFYHLEFENDGDMPTTTLKANVQFPDVFDLTDIQALKWYAAGRLTTPCSTDVAGNACTFDFVGAPGLIKCVAKGEATTSSDTTRCKGYVEFKVKVKPGYDVKDPNNSLMLIDPKVAFGPIWFDLNEFYDLLRVKKGSLRTKLYRPLTTDNVDGCNLNIFWIIGILAVLALILLFIFRKRIFGP